MRWSACALALAHVRAAEVVLREVAVDGSTSRVRAEVLRKAETDPFGEAAPRPLDVLGVAQLSLDVGPCSAPRRLRDATARVLTREDRPIELRRRVRVDWCGEDCRVRFTVRQRNVVLSDACVSLGEELRTKTVVVDAALGAQAACKYAAGGLRWTKQRQHSGQPFDVVAVWRLGGAPVLKARAALAQLEDPLVQRAYAARDHIEAAYALPFDAPASKDKVDLVGAFFRSLAVADEGVFGREQLAQPVCSVPAPTASSSSDWWTWGDQAHVLDALCAFHGIDDKGYTKYSTELSEAAQRIHSICYQACRPPNKDSQRGELVHTFTCPAGYGLCATSLELLQRHAAVPFLQDWTERRSPEPRARVAASFRQERVVVVGGGPVGLLAALHLAARGARVTVLEKRQFADRAQVLDIADSLAEHLEALGLDTTPEVQEFVASRRATVAEVQRMLGRAARRYPLIELQLGVEHVATCRDAAGAFVVARRSEPALEAQSWTVPAQPKDPEEVKSFCAKAAQAHWSARGQRGTRGLGCAECFRLDATVIVDAAGVSAERVDPPRVADGPHGTCGTWLTLTLERCPAFWPLAGLQPEFIAPPYVSKSGESCQVSGLARPSSPLSVLPPALLAEHAQRLLDQTVRLGPDNAPLAQSFPCRFTLAETAVSMEQGAVKFTLGDALMAPYLPGVQGLHTGGLDAHLRLLDVLLAEADRWHAGGKGVAQAAADLNAAVHERAAEFVQRAQQDYESDLGSLEDLRKHVEVVGAVAAHGLGVTVATAPPPGVELEVREVELAFSFGSERCVGPSLACEGAVCTCGPGEVQAGVSEGFAIATLVRKCTAAKCRHDPDKMVRRLAVKLDLGSVERSLRPTAQARSPEQLLAPALRSAAAIFALAMDW